MKIEDVQVDVDARWGSSAYGSAYLARRDPQRDAHHATLHITKALGKLAGALDDLDHADPDALMGIARTDVVAKALADIVICAARVASEWPGTGIELQDAVKNRLAEKFPPKETL